MSSSSGVLPGAKPIYTVSASLLNTIMWYKKAVKTKAVEQQREKLRNSINKIYEDNEHTLRGKAYELEVYEGKHKDAFVDLDNVEIETWRSKYVEYADFIIKVVGKLDVWNPRDKSITDIKRPLKLSPEKYTRDYTTQHLVYLYLEPEADVFWYSIGYNNNPFNPEEIAYTSFPHYREDTGNLDAYIQENIQSLIQVLHKENLLELYFKNFKVDF